MLRGEVWLLNLNPTIGAEIRKTRPVIVVNDDEIGVLPLKIIVPVTEKTHEGIFNSKNDFNYWLDFIFINPFLVD